MLPKSFHNKNLGLLLIRIALGVAFVAHGWAKITHIDMFHGFFASIGLSSIVWLYLAAYGEFLGGLALIFGVFTRYASVVLTIIMIVAISFVHIKNGYNLQGGYEYQSVLLLVSIALGLTGAGRYSVDAHYMHKCHEHCEGEHHC